MFSGLLTDVTGVIVSASAGWEGRAPDMCRMPPSMRPDCADRPS